MMENIDFKNLCSELVKAVRGSHSQDYINSKLGFSFNQTSKWERGLKKISWIEFVTLCHHCKYDLDHPLKKIASFYHSPFEFGSLVKHLVGKNKLGDVASNIEISKSSLSSWSNEKSEPPLEAVLKLINYVGELPFFLDNIIGLKALPTFYTLHFLLKEQLNAIGEFPLITAIHSFLQLDVYRKLEAHEEGLISETFKISLEEEKEVIGKMLEVGMIKRVGQVLVVCNEQLNTGGSSLSDYRKSLQVKKYYNDLAGKIMEVQENIVERSCLGYLNLPMSHKASILVAERLGEFYHDIRKILNQDKGERKHFKVLNMQLLDVLDYESSKNIFNDLEDLPSKSKNYLQSNKSKLESDSIS